MKALITFLLVVAAAVSSVAQTRSIVADDVAYSGAVYYFHERNVARTPGGTLMFVWAPQSGSGGQIQYSIYDAGFGIWSPPAAASNAGYVAIQPALAADESGNIHAVWTQRDGPTAANQIFYAKYSTGAWSTPVQVSVAASGRGEESTIEVGTDGTLWVVYNNDGEGTGNEYLYVVKSTDGGTTWSSVASTISTSGAFGNSIEVGRAAIAPATNGKMVIIWDNSLTGSDDRREVFLNTFDGFSWTGEVRISDTTSVDRDHNRYCAVAVDGSDNIYAFYGTAVVSGADPRLSYMVMHKNAWGNTWSNDYTLAIDSSASNFLSVSAVADSDDVIHLAYRRADTTNGMDEIVYRYSADHGSTWSTPVRVSRYNYDGGYVSLANRVRKAYGIDISWRESKDSLVDNQSTLTLFYGNVAYSTTSVGGETTPLSYEILSNFPNPFNPSTTIAFTLAERSDVTLGIYDINGRLVRMLFEGTKEQGSHTLAWDGRDAAGGRVASGTYIAVLSKEQVRQNVKMLLLK